MMIGRFAWLLSAVVLGAVIKDKRPLVFVIGDSISMHYGPSMRQALLPYADYARKLGQDGDLDNPEGANGGDSGMVLDYLRSRCGENGFRPDYLVVNAGLHDVKRHKVTGKIQVEHKAYVENLGSIISLADQRGMRLIWVRTTPVVDSVHNARAHFRRFNKDVLRYNASADSLMQKSGVPVIDLYSFSMAFGVAGFADHVHFRTDIREKQGAFIAGFIAALIEHGNPGTH